MSSHSSNLSRRNFLKKTAVGAGAIAAGSAFPQILAKPKFQKSQPNILFIIVDRLLADQTMGNPICWRQSAP
jgi:hypothetical protein